MIGHEIIHGFDDQGRKFDAKGNLKRLVDRSRMRCRYEERDKCIADEYTEEVPEARVKQNGKLSPEKIPLTTAGVRISDRRP